ncbi:MAG: hypothetical protein EP335_13745 [Alphaproteobacteria bacterium]|nr:MAG: hypothetical protein EP335_13745 [Alphaproteobacteria bacterium]
MDPIQLIGSFVAIALLALVARWMFPNKADLDDARVLRNFARHFPDEMASGAIIGEDGKTALVPLVSDSTRVGLVIAMGDRTVCRLVAGADIAAVIRKDDGLHIRFHDFTQPNTMLRLSGDTLESANNLLTSITIRPAKDAA